jgi:cytochrome c oxidase accessory protein FixG
VQTAPVPPAATELEVSSLRPDGRRVAIHMVDVRGRFIRARRVVFAGLIALYLAAPVVHIGGHPAIHLDVARRRFFLFGASFNAQDFWIVAFLATAVAFSLLFLTAWRGRAWCGWGCPQTVFLEAVYRPIERLIDGPRSRRVKLPGSPWTAVRVLRLCAKHALYLAVSLLISHAALSLFVSASDLIAMVREGPAKHPTTFTWAVMVTGALYFNFGWFREQFCVVLCPYGRMQSVLHDRDSIVIGYDVKRGEPRGKLHKEATGPMGATLATEVKQPSGAASPKGDCIDCKLCVVACPTGIDIRKGLQMECLACAQCIDVCDEVMTKVKRPTGLIRYASLNQLAGHPTRVLRPRLYVYAAAAFIAVTAAGLAIGSRSPFQAIVVRQPGVPWVIDGARIRNQVEVHLTNKRGVAARFHLAPVNPAGVPADVRLGQTAVELPPLGDTRVPLVITLEQRLARPGLTFGLDVSDDASGVTRHQDIRFVAPTTAQLPSNQNQ